MRSKKHAKYIFHLKDGQTVEGFLVKRQWKGHYCLKLPAITESEERTHALDGDLAIPKENVSVIQVIDQ